MEDKKFREMICPGIMEDYASRIDNFRCEWCGPTIEDPYSFRNSDEVLKRGLSLVLENRKEWGLNGLVGDLQAVVINTQEENQALAAQELIDFTGYELDSSYEGADHKDIVLKVDDSADIIVRHRKGAPSPFRVYNIGPKTAHFPDTRLETFVFETPDLEKYVDIQKQRGVRFMTGDIVHGAHHSFIQTIPSSFTGNSLGFIQWRGGRGKYMNDDDVEIESPVEKRDRGYLKNIKYLDHAATRLECLNRDAAIIEFMELTNYNFDFAIYVKSFNSITNVARLKKGRYAQVFTTGIEPFRNLDTSGPTEKYVHNYGPRVHHMAFHTENIEDTFEGLYQDGMRFLLELVGAPDEGLKQTFTRGSQYTFLVNEYIHRYGDFDGFFTRSNVTDLTRATDAQ
ncbi:MAG: hypothetical protein ACMUHB_02440 [Thermoplasmatota archaeon]